jgi:hypothetical protein
MPRLRQADVRLLNGKITGTASVSVTGATNASPIVVSAAAHGLSTGDAVDIQGVAGNTAANGFWKVTVVNANSYSLDGSTGNGAYTSGGTVKRLSVALGRSDVDDVADAFNRVPVTGPSTTVALETANI